MDISSKVVSNPYNMDHIVLFEFWVSGQYENMIGSCLFLNGDIEKINGGADIFDSITEKKLVMSRCLLSKRTEKDETFFTGNAHQEGMERIPFYRQLQF